MRACFALLACAATAAGALPAAAQSDHCTDAPFLTDGESVFSTIDATTDYPERLICREQAPLQFDIWFRYTAACDSYVQLIFRNVTTELTALVYTDSACPPPAQDPWYCETILPEPRWAVSAHVVAGQTYRIQIGSLTGARGSGSLTIVCGAENPACQPYIRGDLDGSGLINGFDIDPFVLMLTRPDEYQRWRCDGSIDCVLCRGDLNLDGAVNNFDIDAFILCLRYNPWDLPCP